jgi:predicted aldo/keto reductase-like oxidoreductase
LGTDYIDLFKLHGLEDPAFLTPELARFVDAQKKAGKIRHFGFSCHSPNVPELLHKAAELPWVETVARSGPARGP